MKRQMDISVIISTYNRREMLREAIESVLAQDSEGVCYEVIVVDNNSTDGTREMVEEEASRSAGKLRYVHERRQGVSYARNAGIAESRGEIIAFADDDVRVGRDWVKSIKRALDINPHADFVGGKVLPKWEREPPSWITRDHWMPLALLDYGDAPFYVSAANPLCLITANLGVRREVFNQTGLFAPELQRVKDGIGSMEDHELLARFFKAGREGLYAPEIVVTAQVPAARMEKSYHRRWHTGHGHFYALMRSEEMESPSAARLLDVPAHLYKQAIRDAARWLRHSVLRETPRALACEMRLRFFAGFFRKRRRDYLARNSHGSAREVARFIRSLATSRGYWKARKGRGWNGPD